MDTRRLKSPANIYALTKSWVESTPDAGREGQGPGMGQASSIRVNAASPLALALSDARDGFASGGSSRLRRALAAQMIPPPRAYRFLIDRCNSRQIGFRCLADNNIAGHGRVLAPQRFFCRLLGAAPAPVRRCRHLSRRCLQAARDPGGRNFAKASLHSFVNWID